MLVTPRSVDPHTPKKYDNFKLTINTQFVYLNNKNIYIVATANMKIIIIMIIDISIWRRTCIGTLCLWCDEMQWATWGCDLTTPSSSHIYCNVNNNVKRARATDVVLTTYMGGAEVWCGGGLSVRIYADTFMWGGRKWFLRLIGKLNDAV